MTIHDLMLHRLRLTCASLPAPLSELQSLTNDPTQQAGFWRHLCFYIAIENIPYESGYASGKFDVIGWELYPALEEFFSRTSNITAAKIYPFLNYFIIILNEISK